MKITIDIESARGTVRIREFDNAPLVFGLFGQNATSDGVMVLRVVSRLLAMYDTEVRAEIANAEDSWQSLRAFLGLKEDDEPQPQPAPTREVVTDAVRAYFHDGRAKPSLHTWGPGQCDACARIVALFDAAGAVDD